MILCRVKARVFGLIPSGAQNRSSRCFAPTRQACGLLRATSWLRARSPESSSPATQHQGLGYWAIRSAAAPFCSLVMLLTRFAPVGRAALVAGNGEICRFGCVV